MEVILAKTIKESVFESLLDGEGVRIVIFFSGCYHHCIECHNQWTWDMKNGTTYSVEYVLQYIYTFLQDSYYDGITLSGGDPYFQSKAAVHLAKEVKKNFPDKTVWVYTGFEFDQIKENTLTKNVDVIVDGPFKKELQFPKKRFRGSTNQRILYVKNGVPYKEE